MEDKTCKSIVGAPAPTKPAKVIEQTPKINAPKLLHYALFPTLPVYVQYRPRFRNKFSDKMRPDGSDQSEREKSLAESCPSRMQWCCWQMVAGGKLIYNCTVSIILFQSCQIRVIAIKISKQSSSNVMV